VSTQVTMHDGTESDLADHLRDLHQKGTRGFTAQYLATLHVTLHQRSHDPQPEHDHPDLAAEIPAQPDPADA
jgi:hypothetical protein